MHKEEKIKQTIEIEIPEGKKAVWKDNQIVFEDIKLRLPKTWEEFCKMYSINNDERFISDFSNICTMTIKAIRTNRNISEDKNLLPSEKAAKQHLALMQLHQLRDCYRQGWVPDWTDYNISKYVIINANETICIDIHISRSRFLAFQSKELAEEFLTNFKDLIEQAGDLV